MNVLRLIAKDLRLQRSFFLLLLLIELGGVALFKLQISNGAPGLWFSLTNGVALIGDFMLCYRTMLAEEKNRALLLIRILPVSVREIVASKFIVNLLLSSLNLLTCFGFISLLQSMDLVANQITWTGALLPFFAFHWLVNSFFVAVSLIADSDKVVWIPFPALFLVISFLLNFKTIMTSAGLLSLEQRITSNDLLLTGTLLMIEAIGISIVLKMVLRKRMFG